MAQKIIMTDGTKSETLWQIKAINPFTDETPGVWSPDSASASAAARSVRLVSSVFAGITTRMQSLSDLPFTIYTVKGDKAIDDSDNYQNKIGFLANPSRFLRLTEAALVSYGRGYWAKNQGEKTGDIKRLQYWLPASVTMDEESAKKGEIKFRRKGVQNLIDAEKVLYFWFDDENVELGPPTICPLDSAMLAAEASGAISGWVRDFMRRGAIKAMILAVDGAPPPAEVERMETWWNKFMTGARGLVWKVFNMTNVKPTIIGDGLEALKDLSIKKDLRYEIHEALGTRHLLEDENYATALARERQFYIQTIVPDARLIQNNLNEQILHAMGFHWEFEPQRMEIFQTDEAERAGSLSQLYGVLSQALSADKALKLSMDILGYDLSAEQEGWLIDGITDKGKEKPVGPPIEKQPPPNKAVIELDRWQAKVEKAGKMVLWHVVDIPKDIAKSVKDGNIGFDTAREMLMGDKPKPEDAAAVLEGLRLAIEHAQTQ